MQYLEGQCLQELFNETALITTCAKCSAGYTGSYCDEVIDCFNNGEKQDSKCRCSPPFTGEFCETISCNGEQVIISDNGDSYCQCSPGWTGAYCEKISFCYHGFNISADGNDCDCDTDFYTGQLCETPTCQNDGTIAVKL